MTTFFCYIRSVLVRNIEKKVSYDTWASITYYFFRGVFFKKNSSINQQT